MRSYSAQVAEQSFAHVEAPVSANHYVNKTNPIYGAVSEEYHRMNPFATMTEYLKSDLPSGGVPQTMPTPDSQALACSTPGIDAQNSEMGIVCVSHFTGVYNDQIALVAERDGAQFSRKSIVNYQQNGFQLDRMSAMTTGDVMFTDVSGKSWLKHGILILAPGLRIEVCFVDQIVQDPAITSETHDPRLQATMDQHLDEVVSGLSPDERPLYIVIVGQMTWKPGNLLKDLRDPSPDFAPSCACLFDNETRIAPWSDTGNGASYLVIKIYDD